MSIRLKNCINWPLSDIFNQTMTACFKESFNGPVIIDCFEVRTDPDPIQIISSGSVLVQLRTLTNNQILD